MPPEERDTALLWDIVRYGEHLVEIVRPHTMASYLADVTAKLATERCIEVIGEAARLLSNQFKQTHDDIAPLPINRIIHRASTN